MANEKTALLFPFGQPQKLEEEEEEEEEEPNSDSDTDGEGDGMFIPKRRLSRMTMPEQGLIMALIFLNEKQLKSIIELLDSKEKRFLEAVLYDGLYAKTHQLGSEIEELLAKNPQHKPLPCDTSTIIPDSVWNDSEFIREALLKLYTTYPLL